MPGGEGGVFRRAAILYRGKALAGDRMKTPEYAYSVEQCDVPEVRRAALGEYRQFRRKLETQLHDRRLDDMTPEQAQQAQQAIYGCRIFEQSLRAHYPELCH
jgi:hypothetical protein